tara:strand:- start:527 stop:742 length:216 start_codon:yes stop_codon:yes gene_type:complete
MIETGMRVGEVINLKIKNINFQDRFIFVTAKNTSFIGILKSMLEIVVRIFIDIKIFRKVLVSQEFNTNLKA